MTVRQIYERVCLIKPIGEREFFDRLNDTIGEITASYGDVPKLLFEEDGNGGYIENAHIKTFDGTINLLPLYHTAIADNILYMSGAGDIYGQEFLKKARDAYLVYWNKNAKGRRVKQSGFSGCSCE